MDFSIISSQRLLESGGTLISGYDVRYTAVSVTSDS